MALAVVFFPLKLCDPNNLFKFFYSLQVYMLLGRFNCRLCRSACIRCSISVIGRCLVRLSTGTWGVPVGLSWFCSVVSRLSNGYFLLNPFPVHDVDIAA
jgi:hypothetical protein